MSQSVLVINSGSSSVKCSIINLQNNTEILSALGESLGSDNAQLTWNYQLSNHAQSTKKSIPLSKIDDHVSVIRQLVDIISVLDLKNAITVVGHRVVHGGESFTKSAVITYKVIAAIKANCKLAPLHNPANLQGIEAAQQYFPKLTQVAVFDTAFHQTLPPQAYLYALPYSLYEKDKIRRYGFHGTSHQYVSQQAEKHINKPIEQSYLITAHLGNGCSICAIKQGKSVDTSMGFTPLAGVMMGTRCGDLDPGLISYLINELGYSIMQIDNLLNKESGLLGVSQLSNDCRTLEQEKNSGNKQALLALTLFCYHIAKTIASYTVPLGKLDAIIFTGGIGENSAYIRETIINFLSFYQLNLNQQANLDNRFGQAGCITSNDGIKVLVIPTNEELVIAIDAATAKKALENDK